MDPSIIKGDWTAEEDELIVEKQKEMGNKWSKISKMLLGRTENAVKVRWKALDRAAKKNALGAPQKVAAESKSGKNGRGSFRRIEGMRRVDSAGARRSSASRSSGKILHNSLDGTIDFDVAANLNNSLEDDRNNSISGGIPIGDVGDYSTMFNSNDGDMMQMSFDVDDDADMLSSQGGNTRNSKFTGSRSQGRGSNKAGSWTELMMFDDPTALNFDVTDVFADD